MEWDPLRDFTYIIGITGYTFGVVVKSDSPFKTFKDWSTTRAPTREDVLSSTGNGTRRTC